LAVHLHLWHDGRHAAGDDSNSADGSGQLHTHIATTVIALALLPAKRLHILVHQGKQATAGSSMGLCLACRATWPSMQGSCPAAAVLGII
jgi:hypothetical protein